MCTLTYLSINNGKGYLVTQNRDESPLRPQALAPKRYHLDDIELIYPKDPQGTGSWIATAPHQQKTVCLLNGGFEKHKHRPPYRHSRGLVVLEVFKHNTAADFYNQFDFHDLEPFTLIIFSLESIHQITWDGSQSHMTEFESKPLIWSSSTLYDSDQKRLRKQWFDEWKKNHPSQKWNTPEILKFHQQFNKEIPESSIKMIRPRVATISTTSIKYSIENSSVTYIDYLINRTQFCPIVPNET